MDAVVEAGTPTGVYNVSTGEGHSIKEVFDEVAAYLGVGLADPVPIVPPGADDVKAMGLDPAATQRAYGWKARVNFADTIRRQLDWYARHGVNDVYSHLAAPAAAR
jgi:nucleoside-diphosphate-sugar epimerase